MTTALSLRRTPYGGRRILLGVTRQGDAATPRRKSRTRRADPGGGLEGRLGAAFPFA